MPKIVVYYFSGTGNSLFIAKALAAQLNGVLIPIATVYRSETIIPDADVIGIVYPVYYNDLPAIVRDFATKLRGIKGRYVFAVPNYGGCGSRSVQSLSEIITAAGGTLSAAFGLHMPQNAFLKFWENNGRLIDRSCRKTKKIIQTVNARHTGNFLKGLLNFIFLRLHPKLMPSIRTELSNRAGLPPDSNLGVLIRSSDRVYTAGNACTGCGLCEKICPVENIHIRDGRPVWLGHCENCLACYGWCPSKAISGTVASDGYYYVNPKIEAADIMSQHTQTTA